MLSDFEIEQANDDIIGAMDIRVKDLAEMSPRDQASFMRQWFSNNFEDPAQSLPYESREGGYIWIDGGFLRCTRRTARQVR